MSNLLMSQAVKNSFVYVQKGAIFLLFLLAAFLFCTPLFSSISAQNILVVENSSSTLSKDIANYYSKAHAIPDKNRLILTVSTNYSIDLVTYISKIENPIHEYIKNEGMEKQIFCVLFMPDFPLEIVGNQYSYSITGLISGSKLTRQEINRPRNIDNPMLNDHFAQLKSYNDVLMSAVILGTSTQNIKDTINNSISPLSNEDNIFYFKNYPIDPQNPNNIDTSTITKVGKPVEVLADTKQPPTAKLLGFYSQGVYSGVTKDFVDKMKFSSKSIAVLSQEFAATNVNLKENSGNILLPVASLFKKNVSGIYTDILNSTFYVRIDKVTADYLAGYSIIEAFYNNMPRLNSTHIIIGDPLTRIYDYSLDDISVSINESKRADNEYTLPLNISAHAGINTTIQNLSVYLDGKPLESVFNCGPAEILVNIAGQSLTIEIAANTTLQEIIARVCEEINNNATLQQKKISATADFRTSTAIITANDYRMINAVRDAVRVNVNNMGESNNNPPRVITSNPSRLVVRFDQGWQSNVSYVEKNASATISLVGRKIDIGDKISINISGEKFTVTVTNKTTTTSDIIKGLANQINSSEVLKGADGVTAVLGMNNMPYLFITANSAGANGNNITYEATSTAESLKAYPTGPKRLVGGIDKDNLVTNIHFRLGEQIVERNYPLSIKDLAPGNHKVTVVGTSTHETASVKYATLDILINGKNPLINISEAEIDATGLVKMKTNFSQTNSRELILKINGNRYPFNLNADTILFDGVKLGAGSNNITLSTISHDGVENISKPYELILPVFPIIKSIYPNFASTSGNTKHTIIGSGFTKGMDVKVAKNSIKSLNFISENEVEIVTQPSIETNGSVEIFIDNTVSNAVPFTYYNPIPTYLHLTPEIDMVNFGGKVKYTATALDKYRLPINNVKIVLGISSEDAGTITQSGDFTAGTKEGKYEVFAFLDNLNVKSTIIVGADSLDAGEIPLWLTVGPYTDDDYNGLSYAYIDEATTRPIHNKAEGILKWQTIAPLNGFFDLRHFYGEQNSENVLAYMHTYIYSPKEQEVKLYYGSDDGIAIHLNASNIITHKVRRGYTPYEDSININLKKGWNTLLVKVDQGTGSWCFDIKITALDGQILDDLRYSLDPQ